MESTKPYSQSSPLEVADAVKAYLRSIGTMVSAAEKLKIKPATLSNHLSGREYLSPKQARRFSEEFGFAFDYLVDGTGEMFPGGESPAETDIWSGWHSVVTDLENIARSKELLRQIRAQAAALVQAIDDFDALSDSFLHYD